MFGWRSDPKNYVVAAFRKYEPSLWESFSSLSSGDGRADRLFLSGLFTAFFP
jgi:hypothetical protein